MYLKTFKNSLNLFWIRLLEIESKEKNCIVLCKIQTKVAAAARYKYDEVNRHIYIHKYVYIFICLYCLRRGLMPRRANACILIQHLDSISIILCIALFLT